MRTISADQKQAIEDASSAGFLRELNPAFIEKDIHVTQVAIARVLIDCLPDDPAVDSSPEEAPQSWQE